MAILTVDDSGVLFEDFGLPEEQLALKLAQAQAIIEGPLGANRPLERKRVTQTSKVKLTLQTCQCAITPIDLTQSVTVKVRSGNFRGQYHRAVPLSEWYTLPAGDYQIDPWGAVSLYLTSTSWLSSFGFTRTHATEIQLSYVAGYSFTSTTDPDVLAIKAATANVLTFMQKNSSMLTGVKSVEVNDWYKVEFGESKSGSSGSGVNKTEIPESLLYSVRKYRSLPVSQTFLQYAAVS